MNIKKTLLFSATIMFALTSLLTSCSKIENALVNDIAWKGYDVVVTIPPVSDTTMQNNIGSGTFTYNLDSLIQANTGGAFKLSNIDTLRLTACTLTINNANAANNFANFQQCSLSFSTATNPTMVSMGQITNNPDSTASYLAVPVNSNVNLRSYVSSSNTTTFNYSVSGKLRRPTTDSLSINVHVEYHIHVK